MTVYKRRNDLLQPVCVSKDTTSGGASTSAQLSRARPAPQRRLSQTLKLLYWRIGLTTIQIFWRLIMRSIIGICRICYLDLSITVLIRYIGTKDDKYLTQSATFSCGYIIRYKNRAWTTSPFSSILIQKCAMEESHERLPTSVRERSRI